MSDAALEIFDVDPDDPSPQPQDMLFRPHLDDFEVGRTYEIGLGIEMKRVWWWRRGRNSVVFANGPHIIGSIPRDGPPLEMELVNTARFTVVE